ncbi:hypothetical protein PA25_23550 [Pseudoalteromonas sp. A25]|uniref:hypothetical protein n=1 Tax=Pseudoalteromonas sp. A25 TaxID=116092 RepID=UPI001260E7D5|nr:hypothetical protein [Pseudoalteromonas sp. A25]BBN82370.1 hypothetical protein PA25_23550 [Pseudoalteromonas sp. A25]
MRSRNWFVISCLCVLFLSVISAPMSYAQVENHYEQQQSIFIDSDPIDHDPQELIVGSINYDWGIVDTSVTERKVSSPPASQYLNLAIRAPPLK